LTEGPGHDPPAPPQPDRGGRRPRRGLDRAIGIVLGILIGVGIVTAFVFLGSEGTIDAPRIEEGGSTGGAQRSPANNPRKPRPKPVPVVRVIGGAPPPSGPPRLDFRHGRTIRFRVLTDTALGIEVPGYGIHRTVESAETLSFPASRIGQFPVIVDFSHIAVATLRVQR
jgi:hypothetical protein